MKTTIRQSVKEVLIWGGIALLVMFLYQLGFWEPGLWSKGLSNIAILVREAVPPDVTILPVAAQALWETIQIAFTGTILGFFAAVPLAFLGTSRLFSPPVVVTTRFVIGVIRSVPSIMWAVIMVIIVGLGPRAGTLGVSLYTVGYLAKLYYEAFDAVDPEIMEAVRSTGARPWHLARFVIWPESVNYIISQLMFMFEYNVRAASILGFVGAGGIGFYFQTYLARLDYARVLTLMVVIFIFVLTMDAISARLRQRYLLGGQ